MKKILFLVFSATMILHLHTNAQLITVAKNAKHVIGIMRDTIIVASGSTYKFTVDTPEDKGLVSTRPNVNELFSEIISKEAADYSLTSANGVKKDSGQLQNGDQLIVSLKRKQTTYKYHIVYKTSALNGILVLEHDTITANTNKNLTMYFTAGQRSPDATVKIYLPAGIHVNLDNTTVNVIGRGDVKLKDLSAQSIGRVGSKYSYSKVGLVAINKTPDGRSVLTFSHLDLRPLNGYDLKLVISNVNLPKVGSYQFKSSYTTSQPEILTSGGSGSETATLKVVNRISDFERVLDKSLQYRETSSTYTDLKFRWSGKTSNLQIMQSIDNGKTWQFSKAKINGNQASIAGLKANELYTFRLTVKDGPNKGFSNKVHFYSGKRDVKDFGINGEDGKDYTEKINEAIQYMHDLGGGTLLFSKGIYSVRTVHLQSNVYLYLEKGATIKALKGADAPESTWFSDKKYRSGTSPTDPGPYDNPENWLTKQDVGHHYFRNAMFTGERLDNIKIIGNGLITGNGNLVNSDRVMNNAPDNRADKMFSLKLCTNIEIGGIYRDEDLWYDEKKDEPYYIGKDGLKVENLDNMLHIDRGGHFVLLATGTDNINVHNTYFGKLSVSNARDIYDFMQCNNVTVTNIYSKQSSDDIVKPGSDCSLGFTRPAKHYRVRNIIGDTNCNLFQIGSETADDIMDICVDNIYVLGANKAGFSISTNDGAHIKDIHLNCGHTGKLHSRSKMYRTFAPFFISISNRGRILGADAAKYSFTEAGVKRNELLVKNVNIGMVENIILNGIDIYEVYAGSSYGGQNIRWKAYDGSQRRATPIIAGYSLPLSDSVDGGLDFKLPDGRHTGYITNIQFNDVNILVKGGNPLSDAQLSPPELGVGQYNVSNLKVQPSYGLWARHVKGLKLNNSSFNYEKTDNRYAIFLDDVVGAEISSIKMMKAPSIIEAIKQKNSSGISIKNVVYYESQWGSSPIQFLYSNN